MASVAAWLPFCRATGERLRSLFLQIIIAIVPAIVAERHISLNLFVLFFYSSLNSHRMGADCNESASATANGEGTTSRRGRKSDDQHFRPALWDVAQHNRKISRHPARLKWARIFLRRWEQGVFFWSRSGDLSTHNELLSHRKASLSASRMLNELRWGIAVFWRNAWHDWRLLLWRVQRSKTRECRTVDGW